MILIAPRVSRRVCMDVERIAGKIPKIDMRLERAETFHESLPLNGVLLFDLVEGMDDLAEGQFQAVDPLQVFLAVRYIEGVLRFASESGVDVLQFGENPIPLTYKALSVAQEEISE